MTILANIIADSISTDGKRITTFQIRHPRFIHSEFLRHRVFSNSASSSRAIPVSKLAEEILLDKVNPSYWGKNEKGMQANSVLSDEEIKAASEVWDEARESAYNYAIKLANLGVHKQISNRILEPFSHINVVVTATEWDNFYKLRMHKDAQPELKALAESMFNAQRESKPLLLGYDEWHLPYITYQEFPLSISDKLKVSTARCARVSYMTFDKKYSNLEEDLKLYNKLITSEPLHASPAEHQACSLSSHKHLYGKVNMTGNFKGWIQHRKLIEAGFVV